MYVYTYYTNGKEQIKHRKQKSMDAHAMPNNAKKVPKQANNANNEKPNKTNTMSQEANTQRCKNQQTNANMGKH